MLSCIVLFKLFGPRAITSIRTRLSSYSKPEVILTPSNTAEMLVLQECCPSDDAMSSRDADRRQTYQVKMHKYELNKAIAKQRELDEACVAPDASGEDQAGNAQAEAADCPTGASRYLADPSYRADGHIDLLGESPRRRARAEKGEQRADITLQDVAMAKAQPSSLPAQWWMPTNTLNIILRAMLGRSPASCPISVSVVDRLDLCVLGAPVLLVPERPLHADPWDLDFELPGASPPSSRSLALSAPRAQALWMLQSRSTEMEEKDSMRFGDDDTDEEGRDDDVFDEGRDEEDGGRTDDEDRADIADEDEQAYSENSDDDEQGYLEDSDEDVEDTCSATMRAHQRDADVLPEAVQQHDEVRIQHRDIDVHNVEDMDVITQAVDTDDYQADVEDERTSAEDQHSSDEDQRANNEDRDADIKNELDERNQLSVTAEEEQVSVKDEKHVPDVAAPEVAAGAEPKTEAFTRTKSRARYEGRRRSACARQSVGWGDQLPVAPVDTEDRRNVEDVDAEDQRPVKPTPPLLHLANVLAQEVVDKQVPDSDGDQHVFDNVDNEWPVPNNEDEQATAPEAAAAGAELNARAAEVDDEVRAPVESIEAEVQ
ncbi:hypothetical protein EV715DRAFT_267641 [Schizophyllum commune]